MEYTPPQPHQSTSYCFEVADFECFIGFSPNDVNDLQLLPSLRPFLTEHGKGNDVLFSLRVDDQTKPWPKDKRERIRVFDTGNGDTIVDLLDIPKIAEINIPPFKIKLSLYGDTAILSNNLSNIYTCNTDCGATFFSFDKLLIFALKLITFPCMFLPPFIILISCYDIII